MVNFYNSIKEKNVKLFFKLSAFLSVSSHTEFINDGARKNVGIFEKNKSKIERSGVIIGLIGARLVKRNFMEAEDIIISKDQNVTENGYGFRDDIKNNLNKKVDYRYMWNKFYEEEDFLYKELKIDNHRFHKIKNDDIFDAVIMKKRYTISFDTLLLEADIRAKTAEKQAYIHVVGIGLGVWKCWNEQEKVFLATFEQRIKHLLPRLNNISCIHFSYFQTPEFGDIKNQAIFKNETHTRGGIRIFVSKRNPHEKLVS